MQDQEYRQMHTSDHKLPLTSKEDIQVEINKGILIQRATWSAHEEVDNIIV